MAPLHWVRLGVLGQLGCFAAIDVRRYPRGARVIVRSGRGLEVGEVLGPAQETPTARVEGSLVRGMTVEDELLAERLARHRIEALEACERELAARELDVALVDAELLFDGQTLVFYFLGSVPPECSTLTAELAAAYDAQAQLAKFADVLAVGCGPDCGTEHAAGHGCTTCASGCALSSHCGSSTSQHA